MKREQTISWVYFRMLYCTGTQLDFIDWLCGTEPISCVTMPVSKYIGQTQPEPPLLALTGKHLHGMVGKGLATPPSQASLLHVNSR